ncbi:Hsp20/alpha crystallin family protein [Phytomonospora sp. NPDC050363]|uniref:Hsp20/alpha crystallin family protein n=1 Tax=Phytomonospora sp. NPDC050363 TaxID=3155642 RepID=UPI0033E28A0A
MLMRTDPFRELDRLTQRMFTMTGTQATMPMAAYRDGEHFVVEVDLPGVDAGSIDLEIERDVLTVKAERKSLAVAERDLVLNERQSGAFSRQLFLGESLDKDRISAGYADGVLTLRIPVAEKAKPRKVEVTGSSSPRQIEA